MGVVETVSLNLISETDLSTLEDIEIPKVFSPDADDRAVWKLVNAMSLSRSPLSIAFICNPKLSKPIQWILKRSADFIMALGILLILAIPILVIIIAIKLDSPGPVIFKQKRVGRQGREFYIYKFRTMIQDAEAQREKLMRLNELGRGMFKITNDPRITSIGHILRKYSLDEVPQLVNVLHGDMSLIGPRPPLVSELSNYSSWHFVRFSTLPGMTGLWQVSGRSDIRDFDEVVRLDFRYIYSWSLWSDIKILLKTIPVVLAGKGAK